jgi:hypothetical protein
MEQEGDGKDFSHHLEMATHHHGALNYHLQKMSGMHGKTDVGDADEGDSNETQAVGKAAPFKGEESAKEEAGEEKQQLAQRKRRR